VKNEKKLSIMKFIKRNIERTAKVFCYMSIKKITIESVFLLAFFHEYCILRNSKNKCLRERIKYFFLKKSLKKFWKIFIYCEYIYEKNRRNLFFLGHSSQKILEQQKVKQVTILTS